MHFLLLLLFPLAATAMDMPCVNCSTIPPAAAGHADVRLRTVSTNGAPAGDGLGAVRTVCSVSHYNYDDALLFPGQPGKAHLHMYWGNTSANAWTTTENILTTGNGTCRGGIYNRSAYWIPAIIDKTDGAVIVPDRIHVYYKTGYDFGTPENRRNEEIMPMPDGLRMIAGDAKRTATSVIPWSRTDARYSKSAIHCGGQKLDHFAECGNRNIKISVTLPQCWDGKDLYRDDQSHMRHARRQSGGCPSSHPIAIPAISYQVDITVPEGRSAGNFRLSSDHYPLDQPGGYSLHADWINGWQPGAAELFVRDVINKGFSGGSGAAGGYRVWF